MTPNIKGAWEILGTLNGQAYFMTYWQWATTNNVGYLTDIGFDRQGGGGPVETLLNNIHFSSVPILGGSPMTDAVFAFGIDLPAGTTLFIRTQASAANATLFCRALFGGVPFDSGPVNAHGAFGTTLEGVIATYGANSSGASTLTSIDPGGSANTKGAWVTVTAQTEFPTRYLHVQRDNLLNNTRVQADYLVDIGIGPVGGEEVIIPNLNFTANTGNDLILPNGYGPIPIYIPAGSRIAARAACTSIDAVDRLVGIGVYANG